MDEKPLHDLLRDAAEAMAGSELQDHYDARHGIEAAPVLTVHDDETAHAVVSALHDRIAGRTVVEIGGGIGLLALHMGTVARRVWCIEANPVWASSFITALLAHKPPNVSYLFGGAEEFVGTIRADVAVIATHSGLASMKKMAAQFAPVIIDVYGEAMARNPERFDPLAMELRNRS